MAAKSEITDEWPPVVSEEENRLAHEFFSNAADRACIVPLTPAQNRVWICGLYKAGHLTWGEAFIKLYNAGFRGREANPGYQQKSFPLNA